MLQPNAEFAKFVVHGQYTKAAGGFLGFSNVNVHCLYISLSFDLLMLLWLLLFAIKKVAFICLFVVAVFFSPLSHLLSRLQYFHIWIYNTQKHRQSSRVRAYIRNERVRAHLTEYTQYTIELEEGWSHRRIARLIAGKHKNTALTAIQHQNDTANEMGCVAVKTTHTHTQKSHLKRNLRIKTSFFLFNFFHQLARVWNEFQLFVSIFPCWLDF